MDEGRAVVLMEEVVGDLDDGKGGAGGSADADRMIDFDFGGRFVGAGADLDFVAVAGAVDGFLQGARGRVQGSAPEAPGEA